MENATRALTMAGGILIALMILGALMLMFNNLSNYQNQNDASLKSSQVAEFNNQFEPYNKSDLTLMELKTAWNKIQSNNKKNPEYEIDTNIDKVYTNIDKDFSNRLFFSENDKQMKMFRCKKIEYNNEEGRISKIEFEDVTP